MRGRRRLLAALLAAAIVLVAGRAVAALWVEYEWFAALGLHEHARTHVWAAVLLRGGTTALAMLFLFTHLYAVRRSVVSLVLPSRVGDIEFGEEVPGRYLVAAAVAVAAVAGSFLGLPSDAWPQFVLAAQGAPFSERDPYFGHDLGFFVAWLPAEITLHGWAQRLLLATSAVVVGLYALTPSVRWRGRTLYVSEYVRRHVTILGGLLLLLFAWAFRLERYTLLIDGNGVGGLFTPTDLVVRVPGALVLAGVSLGAGLVVLWAGFVGQVRLAFAAVTMMLLVTVATRFLAPAIIRPGGNAARVARAYQSTRDAYSRRAFGADRVAFIRAPDGALTVPDRDAVATWDAEPLRRAIDGAVAVGWMGVGDRVHATVVQRGFVDGADRAPWTVSHVATAAADALGDPVILPAPPGTSAELLPPAVMLDTAASYMLVDDPGRRIRAARLGQGGSRLAHAWALQNFRLLRRPEGMQTPTLVLHPSVVARLAWVAPFFTPGHEVSVAVSADTLVWVVPMYVAAATYPLAEPLRLLGDERRYFQPAGHALVNAVSGLTRVLAVADPDPLVQSWVDRFPELFIADAAVPATVRAALTPPIEAVRARAITYARVGPTAFDAPAARRSIVVEEGADSALAGTIAPMILRGAPGLATTVAVLGVDDRVAGLVAATGPSGHTRWIPARSDAPFWGDVLDRLRRADSSSARRDARMVRGRVRALPVAGGIAFLQATYHWPARGGPALAGTQIIGDAVAAPSAGPVGAGGPRTDGPVTTARDLYTRMRDALRRGDWSTFGAAFDSLGQALARTPR